MLSVVWRSNKLFRGRGEVCVDLGSGRGTDAIRLSEIVGKEGHVYGIDISDGMIQKARVQQKDWD